MSTPRPLDVLIVNYGGPEQLEQSLPSVREHLPDAQVRVWDNRSDHSDEVRRFAERYPEVDWTFSPVGVGYAAAANQMVARSDHDTLELNTDAVVLGPLTGARAALREHRVAAASPSAIDPTGRAMPWDIARRRQTVPRVLLNHSGYAPRLRRLPLLSDLYPAPPHEVDGYITGCVLLVSREAWDDVGPLDERFFVYGEDWEWQRRALERGWRVRFVDEPGVTHVSVQSLDDPPIRMKDMSLANRAVVLGFGSGRGQGALVTGGEVALDRLQRTKRRRRAALMSRMARDCPAGPDVVITSLDLRDADGTRARVELANELARRGLPVTVVCTEGLGVLERRLDMSVRLLLRPSWLPATDSVKPESVLISGGSDAEVRFARRWVALDRRRRRWLIAGSDLGGPAVADRSAPLAGAIAAGRAEPVEAGADGIDAVADAYLAVARGVLH